MKDVVIVDDSSGVRERLIALLSENPEIRIVGQAGNGREALAAMRALKPDAVILDIRLPGRSGIQVLKEIKLEQPRTMVIMLTNYDFAHYRRQCLQLGADYFFNKTLEFEKVMTVLAEHATGAGSAGSGENERRGT